MATKYGAGSKRETLSSDGRSTRDLHWVIIGSESADCLIVASVTEFDHERMDWAAYIDSVGVGLLVLDDEIEAVRAHGHKLTEAQARAFFPQLKDVIYRH